MVPLYIKNCVGSVTYLYRNVEFSTRHVLFCMVWRIRFNTSTPSESTVAPKSNLIRLGSAQEWSGVWIGPYIFQKRDVSVSFRKVQIFHFVSSHFVSQSTDFSFRFVPFRFVPFRFLPFRFVSFRFAKYNNYKQAGTITKNTSRASCNKAARFVFYNLTRLKRGFDSIPCLIAMSKTEMKTLAYNLRCFVTSALRCCFHQRTVTFLL